MNPRSLNIMREEHGALAAMLKSLLLLVVDADRKLTSKAG